MRRKIPPFGALIAFEVVGRTKSLGLAAIEMGVTHSAISHQIRNLEKHMNAPLFIEKGRALSLTWHGQKLANTLSQAFDDIERDFSDLNAPPHSKKSLKIATSTAIASTAIPHYAAEFMRQHDLVDFTWVPVDEMGDDVDLIVSWKPVQVSGEVDVIQIPINYFLVCSPKLLHEQDPPKNLRDLTKHTIIHGDSAGHEWRRFLKLVGHPDIVPKSNMYLNNTFVAHQAARSGCGIAIGDEIMVDQDLRDGLLICPLPYTAPSPSPIRIITPFHSQNNPVVQEFKEWFLRKVSQLQIDLRNG